MTIEQRVLVVLGLVLIAGCAGYQAMVIERPPVQEACGILVCEHWGPGKVDLEKDCECSHSNSLPEIM